jgi:peroxiredoxin
MTLTKRLTLVVKDGKIEKVFYPVFPPDKHGAQVVAWLKRKTGSQAEAPAPRVTA